MKTKFKRAFTKNVGLKLLALCFAFLLWLAVVNIDDPTQTRTFTAVVNITNSDVLAKSGKLFRIKDSVNTVSFRVTAKRSIIEKLSSSDFNAVADMNYLESEERIPVTISAKSYENYITISSKQNYIYVVLEDEANNRFMITPKIIGNLSNDMAIESVKCSPSVITVSGTKAMVEKISKVEAICDITGVTADMSENVMLKLFDKDGKEIDTTGLVLSTNTVAVNTDFVNMKTVDINLKTSGVLPPELSLGSVKVEPASIRLKGEAVDLNDITSINIPDTVVNLSDVTGSYSTVIDISAYLPKRVSLADGVSSKATIYVTMEGESGKVVEVPTKNISLVNLDDSLKASMDEAAVLVNVFGTEEVLGHIDANDISAVIDCTELSVGEHQSLVAHFNSPDGVTVQNLPVSVTIVANQEQDKVVEESEEE